MCFYICLFCSVLLKNIEAFIGGSILGILVSCVIFVIFGLPLLFAGVLYCLMGTSAAWVGLSTWESITVGEILEGNHYE